MHNPIEMKKGGMREVITIALPMVVSYACETVMIFTDRVFLARLSPELMNASMAGGVTAYMMMTFFLGLAGYTTALAAQYLGAKQKEKAPLVVTQALMILLVGYPFILACRPLVYFLFDQTGIDPGQLGPQLIYFNILMVFCLIPLMRQTLSAYFTGIGKTRIVMVAAIVAMVVNVAANYVLIFGKFGLPALGIVGAAYGTVIGAICGLTVLLFSYLGPNNWREFAVKRSLHFDRQVMTRLLRFGTPPGLEMFLSLVAFDLMVLILHSVGSVGATASSIALNWDMVTYIPLMGLEMGITSLVGRYMGARDIDSAKQSTKSALKMGFIYAFMILLAFVFFAEPLVDIFLISGDQQVFHEVRPIAIFMLRMIILYVWIQAIFVVLIGSLRGAGDTYWAMGFSVILHWVMVPILYIMLHVYNAAIEMAWVTIVTVFMCSSFFLVYRYRRGRWTEIQVVPAEQEAQVLLHDDFPGRSEF